MKDFLKAEKGWKADDKQHQEVVFNYNLKNYPHILVRVYSGIKADDQQSRGCGKDAIRVCAVNLATDRGFIKTSRVYRVNGWQANLKNRVCDVINQAEKRIRENK